VVFFTIGANAGLGMAARTAALVAVVAATLICANDDCAANTIAAISVDFINFFIGFCFSKCLNDTFFVSLSFSTLLISLRFNRFVTLTLQLIDLQ